MSTNFVITIINFTIVNVADSMSHVGNFNFPCFGINWRDEDLMRVKFRNF